MPPLRPLPLGQPIPNRPHAISVSLPTMADLIGYEEKKAAVLQYVPTGYPRFVVHPYVRTFTAEFARRHGLQGLSVWLATSVRLAEQLLAWVGAPGAKLVAEGRLGAIAFPPNPEHDGRAKAFLQHTGGFVSSRCAEDALVAAGLLPAPAPEERFDGDALAAVCSALGRAYPGASPDDLFLAANGMNAIHSVFRASAEIQAARGRSVWLQLGWIYLDTMAILRKFTARAGDHLVLPDVGDLGSVEEMLERFRGRVAGIVTEVPTNPLIQTCDVAGLAALARRHGAHLLLDASIASPWNVDVLRHCDVALASLTKYAASDGDLLVGSAAVNPAGPDAAAFRSGIAERIEPPYARDLARLAREIQDLAPTLARINASTPRVAEYLAARPEVACVHWALAPGSRARYRQVARHDGAVGSMISFELRPGISLAGFYDRVRLPKGPSFGLKTSLLCPFMYLAHYDLLTSAAGRAELARHRLNPELLRLSVGTEPVDDLIAALGEAFAAARG